MEMHQVRRFLATVPGSFPNAPTSHMLRAFYTRLGFCSAP